MNRQKSLDDATVNCREWCEGKVENKHESFLLPPQRSTKRTQQEKTVDESRLPHFPQEFYSSSVVLLTSSTSNRLSPYPTVHLDTRQKPRSICLGSASDQVQASTEMPRPIRRPLSSARNLATTRSIDWHPRTFAVRESLSLASRARSERQHCSLLICSTRQLIGSIPVLRPKV